MWNNHICMNMIFIWSLKIYGIVADTHVDMIQT